MTHPSSRRSEVAAADLNLTPIMSVLVILIPVLLFAFTFFEVKIQAVAAPRMDGCCRRSAEPPLSLTVRITARGFAITHRDAPELPLIGLRSEADQDGDPYDYAALYNALVAIKERHPEAVAIALGGDDTLPWSRLSRTMDAVRTRLAEDRYGSVAAWAAAPARLGLDGAPEPLFDQISLVVAL